MTSVSGDDGVKGAEEVDLYNDFEEEEVRRGGVDNDDEDEEEHGPDLESELAELDHTRKFLFPDESITPLTEDGARSPSGFPQPALPEADALLEADTLPDAGTLQDADGLVDTDSIPDDTPSLRASLPPSPGAAPFTPDSRSSSRLGQSSPSSQPFERRFHARKTSLQLAGPRSISPAFLSHQSRQVSQTSNFTIAASDSASVVSTDQDQPWEVVRWTKLKKISSQAFSESARRIFGRPTYLAVSASIVVGTSKGIILLFDYQQTLKSIIGQGTPSTEAGSVTSLALSADHSVIASGHANGSIFTWEIARPSKPFLHIDPMPRSYLRDRTTDGHLEDRPVIHIGFLGTRRTALVSADDCGMAFSHLASRGLGPLGRTVTTTRILGRYPNPSPKNTANGRPSSVLAFAPLPLGNIEQATDNMGLTALLTPYLLVVVSTTPVAQTHFKAPRSKDISAHGAMTGCLAWFPAVRLKQVDSKTGQQTSRPKLVWCWSDVLTILEIHEVPNDEDDKEKLPALDFRIRTRWKCEESITSVQWLSRSVLAVLTITERLIILEDVSMRSADVSDMSPKHIFHSDFFSRQLQPLVEKADLNESTLHGVVPDAYHMSFKTYKGRLFLLGVSDISMGTLSNWADRLVALMDKGRMIDAIELATSYYVGDSERITVGLPENDTARHDIVRERLVSMLTATLDYVFNADANDTLEKDLRASLFDMVEPIFKACLTMEETGILFDRVYESYSDASCQDAFLYTMEPYILEGRIDFVPPDVLKDMINWYASHDLRARLEELLLSLRTDTMDIDQITSLCKTHGLYDALIYIWNQALQDYVTPLIQLCRLPAMMQPQDEHDSFHVETARRIFPYLAYTLTGRRYPDEAEMPLDRALKSKTSIYGFIFSETLIHWPQPDGSLVRFEEGASSKRYPYLKHLMMFDASSFLSTLNEAFEDGYLESNPSAQPESSMKDDFNSELKMTRQRMLNILMEALANPEYDQDQRVYLAIFIARNLAKYNMDNLMLHGGLRAQQRILSELCSYTDQGLAEDCQLSMEYFLSVFEPSDPDGLVNLLEKAHFYRVLRSVYKKQRSYVKWLEACFADSDSPDAVFDCIRECFNGSISLNKRQLGEIKDMILQKSPELAARDVPSTAICVLQSTPDLLDNVFAKLGDSSEDQLDFLKTLFEPTTTRPVARQSLPATFIADYTEKYVQLMCKYRPQHVADYIATVSTADLNLKRIIPTLEQSGVMDAAVSLLANSGLAKDAMSKLMKHLMTLQAALLGLLDNEDPDGGSHEEAVDDVLTEIKKYSTLGIWLCQSQGGSQAEAKPRKQRITDITEADLTTVEALWVDLLSVSVDLSRSLSQTTSGTPSARASNVVRTLTQQAFTTLLAATAHPSARQPKANGSVRSFPDETAGMPRFLAILRCFLSRMARSSPSLADLRKVLSDIFSAYAFEESMLSLSNSFVDKDIFAQLEEVEQARRRGWRAKSVGCEGCRKRAWGSGAGEGIWNAWKAEKTRRRARLQEQQEAMENQAGARRAQDEDKGKGRAAVSAQEQEQHDQSSSGPKPDALILFACTHLWHRECLKRALGEPPQDGSWRCPLCD